MIYSVFINQPSVLRKNRYLMLWICLETRVQVFKSRFHTYWTLPLTNKTRSFHRFNLTATSVSNYTVKPSLKFKHYVTFMQKTSISLNIFTYFWYKVLPSSFDTHKCTLIFKESCSIKKNLNQVTFSSFFSSFLN